MVGENTSRFLPAAASRPIRTASATPQFKNVTSSAGVASSGWWVSTKIGPFHAPPYGRLSFTTSQPSRPPKRHQEVPEHLAIRCLGCRVVHLGLPSWGGGSHGRRRS